LKEAILYQKLDFDKVQCKVCNHYCKISEGKRGICGVRENIHGVLFSLNYGKTIARAIDPIEKKPLYHFMPKSKIYSFATVGCNFHCEWCQNYDISQSSKQYNYILGEMISPEEHVQKAIDSRCPSIAYTYSEPTIFLEYALDTMKRAKEKGLKNVWVTNGYMSKETLELILPYLDAVNVDFKGPDDEVYQKYCGGSATTVMDNLIAFQKAGVHLEITTLIIPGINDKQIQLEKIAFFIASKLGKNIPWHLSRFFPAWKMLDKTITPRDTLEMAKTLGKIAGLNHIYLGNV